MIVLKGMDEGRFSRSLKRKRINNKALIPILNRMKTSRTPPPKKKEVENLQSQPASSFESYTVFSRCLVFF
jgi:hypothetical protein